MGIEWKIKAYKTNITQSVLYHPSAPFKQNYEHFTGLIPVGLNFFWFCPAPFL